MRAANTTPGSLSQRLVAELNRDKKKTTVLVVLALVALVLVLRLALHRPGPRRARAGAVRSALVASGGVAGTGSPDLADQKDLAAWLHRRRREDRDRRECYLAGLDRRIDRDLFKPNLEYFPLADGAEAACRQAAAGPGWFDAVRQYVLEKQRAQTQYLDRVRGVRAEARALSLTSTMLGASPAAVINGKVLRVGDVIDGFRLERIDSARCTLVKEGVRVELRMQKDKDRSG